VREEPNGFGSKRSPVWLQIRRSTPNVADFADIAPAKLERAVNGPPVDDASHRLRFLYEIHTHVTRAAGRIRN
jgi:hypothetical protein